MQKTGEKKNVFPAQSQKPPGLESKMRPQPEYETVYPGSNKLLDKICIVTGGDSGIGRAVSVAFAKEGADIAIIYLNEDSDARETAEIIENQYSRKCLLLHSDLSSEENCISAIKKIIEEFDHIDILINNAGMQIPSESILDITSEHLLKTFSVNIFAMFWLVKAALPVMKEGSCIINTASVTAYRGSGELLDYSATKGAIVSFTRSLSSALIKKGIRVNGVAPGPVWTPLIAATFPEEKIKTFGTDSPMGRAGQPAEIAPSYVFLASEDSAFITGQFIHPNGGEIVNG
jgi:NAD(P)-dependent dehydrogenase (short-subunit alcohol dehydrogenase family)